MKMNNRGQFSIIAALLVAIILVATVMSTYAAIRYNSVESQPQTLSSVDEVNQALRQLLGFTVGYYGSILQVTGNTTYAQGLARNYLNSGLQNIVEIRPENGLSFTNESLSLQVAWFGTESYSSGQLSVNYSLGGLGLYGLSYSPTCRIDLQVYESPSGSPASLSVVQENGAPLNTLTKDNFKFYHYLDSDQVWELVAPPNDVEATSDGTYHMDTPAGVDATCYVIQVKDARGVMVVGSSFNGYASPLIWNSSYSDGDYVDIYNTTVSPPTDIGTHSNFALQQAPPGSIFDVLKEGISSTTTPDFYPTSFTLRSSTTNPTGGLTDLQAERGGYMQFRSYPSAFGTSTTFGYTTKGSSTNDFSYVRGSRFTCTTGGAATRISANLIFTSTSASFGNSATGSSGTSIQNNIIGQRFTSPSSLTVVQSIDAYIYCTTLAKNMEAAIYDSSGNLVATTAEKSVSAGSSASWQTFSFLDPKPTLTASTNYVLVVWSQSGNGNGDLRYSSQYNGNGRSLAQTYGNWPSPVSFSTNSYQYSIHCNYATAFKAKAAIYTSNGGSLVGSTDEQTIATSVNGWVDFAFSSSPTLSASTSYLLAVWASDATNVLMYYNAGSSEYFRQTATYPSWPSTVTDQGASRTYSIYCTYSQTTQYTAGVEFTGWSNTFDWTQLIWKINGTCTASANVILQLRNQVSGQYPTSGSGYVANTSVTSMNGTWAITTNPTSFRDPTASGEWQINVTAVAASQFDMNLDLVRYTPTNAYYGLDLEEQWTNVNITRPNYDLCIKTGALASDTLRVDVWNNQSGSGYWSSLFNATKPLVQNTWNNVTVTQYVTSPTFTLRFISNDASDTHQDSWNVSTVELRPQPDLGTILSQQDSTTVVEWLQNGTMRRLGQNLQLTSQEKPIPPLPVRAIHLNQTFVNGTVKEVPFQVEDWASSYRIPLGMSSNETVFSNRQMVVFLMTTDVTQITMWWNGSDTADQTALAYTNTRFNDNPSARTLNNGKLTLNFDSAFNPVMATVGTVTTTANLMRINGEASAYGAGIAYVIYNGTVRDIVQQEAEWGGGAGVSNDCPNLYANTVLTLPAGTSYYTYQLRLMFINSTGHPRTISDLVPIQLASSVSDSVQTENGTLGTSPIVVNGTGMFYNYASAGSWTAHHWSQLINTATGAGSGIMFTDPNNQNLYFFDSRGAGPAATGALNVNSTAKTIELAPVSSLHSVTSYTTPSGDDITWKGAVVTFDGNTTPVYKQNSDNTQSGLWILAEYQPRITVTPMR